MRVCTSSRGSSRPSLLGVLGVLAASALCPGALDLAAPSTAHADGTVYVSEGAQPIAGRTSTVVVLREGERTVLSIQRDYHGPAEGFALVVPVPASFSAADVSTVDPALFDRVMRMGSPRLVELWEENPCIDVERRTSAHDARYVSTDPQRRGPQDREPPRMLLAASRVVGPYDVTVLDAAQARGLEAWLAGRGYQVPQATIAALQPDIAAGRRFVVAHIPAGRVQLEQGRALLPPLRLVMSAAELRVPVSLLDPEELVVVVIARQRRFEAVGQPNVAIATNLDVAPSVAADFAGFHAALLERTFERHHGAVLTEHAWPVTQCDPCLPEATLDADALRSLGGDVLYSRVLERPVPSTDGAPVRIEVTQAEGLPVDIVRRIGRRHVNQLRFCYEQAVAARGQAAGVIDLEVSIDDEGAPVQLSTSVREGSILSERLVSCQREAVRRWALPAPNGQGRFTLALTLGGGVPVAPPSDGGLVVGATEFIATRLRYRSAGTADLVLRDARALVGGREAQDAEGRIEAGARDGDDFAFQARYAVRHPWQGAITCPEPVRGRWAGVPLGGDAMARSRVYAEGAPAHAGRPTANLEALVVTPLQELGLPGRVARADMPTPSAAPSSAAPAASAPQAPLAGLCAASPGSTDARGALAMCLWVLALVRARKRR